MTVFASFNGDPPDRATYLAVLMTAPRTVIVKEQPPAELIGRQLSDREHDPVFRESMAVTQVFARSILG
jgi:hypothetical protein